MLSAVVFESVNSDFYWGSYSDFRVLIMRENGYINATKLCALSGDHEKKLKHWLENQSSMALIDALSTSAGIPADLVVVRKHMSGPNEFRGTYVHLDLVPHIACWVSPSFALKVSRIVNAFLQREERERHEAVIAEKDTTIRDLKAMMARMEADSKAILKTTVGLEDAMKSLKIDNEVTHAMLDDTSARLERTTDILEEVAEDRVVKTDSALKDNTVVIYEDFDAAAGRSTFHIFRVQRANLPAALRKYRILHPTATEFYRIEYNPNAVNYFVRIKQEYGTKEIKVRNNDFELLGDTTKEQLREYLDTIEDEKRVV